MTPKTSKKTSEKSEVKSRYMLVDGNALIHRGYHAMPGLISKSGEPTGAVYGFALIMLKAIADIKPTHIALTFDLAAPTFRHVAYAEYKAHRVKADQSLYDQIPRVKELTRALNIPIFEQEGFEADDMLGTLSREICKKCKGDCDVFIVTGDMDTLQLINDCVKVYTLKKGLTETTIYDAQSVRDRYDGLGVEQLIDYRGLKGDPSDNIPGVKGIGEKGAIEIIKEFGNLDNLYKELKAEAKKLDPKFPNPNFQFPKNFQFKNIKSRILNLLLEQEDMARQSYELSTIKCDVPVKIELPKYEFTQKHFETAFKLFQELEFKSLIPKLPKTYGSSVTPEQFELAGREDGKKKIGQQKYVLVNSLEQLEEVLPVLQNQKELSIDTETTAISAIDADLVGVGICCGEGSAYYVPASIVKQSKAFRELLESKVPKVGHNLKYDKIVLENEGIVMQSLAFDTMIASYLLNPGTRQHGLDAIAFSELGYHMQPIEELIGKGKNVITMDKVEAEKVSWYCCEDVDMTMRLKKIFEPQLNESHLIDIFEKIEMPLVDVLSDMERNGILLDSKLLGDLSVQAEKEIQKLEKEIYKLTGEEFNINSPKQLKEILFDKMKLESVDKKKTKTGLSTAAAELEKMVDQHPVIAKLLEYREITKLQSTYLTVLPSLVSKKTGRLHTSYNQTIAATGRLSSTDPNLQNIPVRGTGLGSQIRQGFVAATGYKLLSLDYSQIELRVIAHIAQDKKMMEVFKSGEDIHAKTAMEIFGVSKDELTPDMRRDAKTVNFGVLYGISSFGLSNRIGEVSRMGAKEFIQKYYEAYPTVKAYMDGIREEVNKNAIVYNELGRARKFPEIKSGPWPVRAAAERAAINFPVQSLAADVIKVAMIDIDKEIRGKKDEIKMLLQVHDELVFEVREDKVEYYAKKIKPFMEQAIKLSVPVQVEAKAGDNWGEMAKLSV